MNTNSKQAGGSNVNPTESSAIICALESEDYRRFCNTHGGSTRSSNPSYPELRNSIDRFLKASDDLYRLIR